MSQYINCGASSIRQCFVAAVRPAKCRLRNPQLHPRLAGHTAAQASDSGPAPLTDASIPEGHRGLHESLYGDGGAEVHSSGADAHSGGCRFREGEDDGTALLPVDSYLSTRGGERPVGVFAIYDSRRNLQYVSYSRNMVLSVRALASRVGEDRCSFVRVMVFANRAMQSRSALQREADNWLKEAGTLPPGNGAESDLWGGVESERAAAMSADEAAEYEEKKTKMQLAMGEKIGAGGDEDSEARREKLRAAIERSDWSEVIEGQTAETVDAGRQQADKQPVVTPFARASVHREIGNETAETEKPAMTIEAVDRALDEVRPYLIADGGNVDVVSVENGVIALQLQGACGTCPSSSATMKMGIERALSAAFGDQLKEVIQVGGAPDPSASVEAVDMHLNMLRGAIAAYGGGVEVVEVGGGRATLRFSGPKPIGYGVTAAIKDKFPDVTQVFMLDMETGQPIEF